MILVVLSGTPAMVAGPNVLAEFRRVLRASPIVLLFLLLSQPSRGAILPTRGTFDGVYHRDRWGVGHFAPYFVAPELHEELKGVEGKRIRLAVRRASQPVNPGPAMIYEIGEIAVLPDLPLEIGFAVTASSIADDRQGVCCYQDVCCYLINRANVGIDTSTQNLVVWIRRADGTVGAARPDHSFPEYTRGQMAIRTIESVQWLGGHLVRARGAIEQGHHLRIEPGQHFPVVARVRLGSGEYEACVRAIARVGDKWLET